MTTTTGTSLAVLALVALIGCGGGESQTPGGPAKRDVLEAYAELAHLGYRDALEGALALQTAIDDLVASPSESTLAAARQAWLDARIPYLQTEAFRFSGGPIDDDDGPEARINAWPLDERYIDYVDGDDTAGIINDTGIAITKERLISISEGGEGDVLGIGSGFDPDKAISTGYHAIEFLLWGQDLSATGPGARPWQDYLSDMSATHPNGDRRGLFLLTAAALLVDDLSDVVAQWEPNADTYRASFVAGDADQALRAILTGLAILSKGELGGQRMDVALDSLDQEDEHSCFSDNTHVDYAMDAQGIDNVYLGRYGSFDGPGIDELVAATDPAIDAEMKARLSASIDAIAAIPAPVDQAIAVQGSDGWNAIDVAVGALFDQGDYFVTVGQTLGLGAISAELPP